MKAFLLKSYARHIARSIWRWSQNAPAEQFRIFEMLIKKGKSTVFGKDNGFHRIKSYDDYRQQVPIRDYEDIKEYIERIKKGENDVLWPGRPRYFAKTSGTTSGVKYIPITNDSLGNHFGTARNALFNYFAHTGRGEWLNGKMIFLSGSPELELVGGIPTGRLSGIANHLVPGWIRRNQMPSYSTNCLDDWEQKLDKIVEETLKEDMRLISGIPPWVQMYYEKLLEKTGKKNIKNVFPNYSVFVYGGVNFEPYRPALENLVGKRIDSVETYPASEGFIAFQDSQNDSGLLLNAASGIFFEFVPAEEIHRKYPTRLALNEVETGVNYALIINNNAGLWTYNLGDTVEFTSLRPFRLKVTGRVKHFISAFGEHVIGKEVEEALKTTVKAFNIKVTEFTVAPQITPSGGGSPYHEWFIELESELENPEHFASILNQEMVKQNIYYEDLIKGKVLQPLKVTLLKKDAFRNYMKQQGKLGGQNKVPRLSNDRIIADALQQYAL